MDANPFLGVVLHMIGGLAAGSFYIPYRKVQKWSWESYWLAGGFFSWIIVPWVLALATTPDVLGVLKAAPWDAITKSYLFGIMWGLGGLTFGLTMRYLGVSLGMAVALGYCAAFGTLMPPIFRGEFGEIVTSTSGIIVLVGVAVCLGGIAISGLAGMSKEREMPEEEKKKTIQEFNFFKGLAVATFSGIMSAGMSYGIAAGKPIAQLARESDLAHGMSEAYSNLWQNTPVFIVILAGGFTANFIWCVLLNIKNGSGRDYLNLDTPLLGNYFFAAVAGTTWYLQFMFYGMGETQMGKYNFSSWSLHMSSIIIFSTLWGIALLEWQGSSLRTRSLLGTGLAVLVLSLCVVGYGNYLAKEKSSQSQSTANFAPERQEDHAVQYLPLDGGMAAGVSHSEGFDLQ
jgi:L-rhamnose-H+ transport protein